MIRSCFRTALCLLLFWMGCSPSPRTADYKVVFTSARSGQRGVFVVNADSTGGKLLAPDERAVLRPSSWSPDGRKIAFFSYRAGDEEIVSKYPLPMHYSLYVMDASGQNQKRLLDFPISSFGWSPDSRKMFFVSAMEDPERQHPDVMRGIRAAPGAIYILDLQSGRHQRLTSFGQNCSASWSPDGTRLAFSWGKDRDSDIYVVHADGGSQKRLTDSPTMDVHPAWSPQGKSIAFVAVPGPETAEQESGIYVIDADGANRTRLSEMLTSEVTWSPDGSSLLAVAANGIFLIGADGTKPVRLQVETFRALDAVFSPDGQKVIYRSNHEGNWFIYALDLKTQKVRRIMGHLSVSLFAVSPLLSKP